MIEGGVTNENAEASRPSADPSALGRLVCVARVACASGDAAEPSNTTVTSAWTPERVLETVPRSLTLTPKVAATASVSRVGGASEPDAVSFMLTVTVKAVRDRDRPRRRVLPPLPASLAPLPTSPLPASVWLVLATGVTEHVGSVPHRVGRIAMLISSALTPAGRSRRSSDVCMRVMVVTSGAPLAAERAEMREAASRVEAMVASMARTDVVT